MLGCSVSDVPVFVPGSGSEAERMRVPRLRLKAFLSDFDDPARLLEMEAGAGAGADGVEADPLASEPCGVLDVRVAAVAAGRDSPFLPEVSRHLPCPLVLAADSYRECGVCGVVSGVCESVRGRQRAGRALAEAGQDKTVMR